MAFFEIKNLKVNHNAFDGKKRVLDIDNISIEKGTTYGIVGESGQGKTVLALTILKLLQCPPGEIESGEIVLDGVNLLEKGFNYLQKEVRGKKIAMIFQDPMSTLNPVFTVKEQMVEVIRKNRKISEKEAIKEAVKTLETVKLADPGNVLTKYPHELSGGQRQRIIIALALSCGAELMIADEPTRNLDATIQASMLKLLKELQKEYKMTVLFIANNLSLVSAFCDRVGILYGGKIIEQGVTEELVKNPQQEYSKLLIEAANIKKEAKKDNINDDIILKVQNLKKYFKINDPLKKQKGLTLKAVDGVSFDIKKGEVLGIVGESGCGKSTLVNTILKLFEPTEGSVYFEGKNIYEQSKENVRKIRKDIQIVFQDPYWSLNPRLLVKDIISEPIDVHEKIKNNEKLERVNELLKMVGLEKDAAFKYPHEFSGGERQRIAIARSLASQPKIIVLDEPTSSIDVFSQAQILELLQHLKTKFDLTNILISHDLGVVNQMASRIAVMYLGKVVEFGPANEVFKSPKHPYTKALFNSIPDIKKIGIEHLTTLEGNIPSPINPPSGCRFHTRCTSCIEDCKNIEPNVTYLSDNHYVSCLLYSNLGIEHNL
ncbi:MAG: ABC transporter ATP-binding protein [Lutispora sp.]|nr:ABC transporter ATP-binding protein [Lutispora sp.]MDD4833792.1 ABC transporter ATP-binding protein [Lutispora sp.]